MRRVQRCHTPTRPCAHRSAWPTPPLQVKEAAIAKLEGFEERGADLIVEVAHPDITRQWGARFLSVCRVGGAFWPHVGADADAGGRLHGGLAHCVR